MIIFFRTVNDSASKVLNTTLQFSYIFIYSYSLLGIYISYSLSLLYPFDAEEHTPDTDWGENEWMNENFIHVSKYLALQLMGDTDYLHT